ncbi:MULTISPECIES: WG repeat-containing protein [Bizionia]|uniref:WG repeat-containing protein n=1 Tax=Bizionia algoritergicola TaxID=291187 RepID=A0A5D0QW55_9FLAO|nr:MULTISPECIES: WG repeat-containing protein [Bizionia]OBX23359.1 hypothetical protein BAA08_04705 [Bizionia sp. APA-3]TYB73352.1 WG repeat-containing protein [Bizionia algoritergicola]UPS91279.1 WG repeat-containing protein [Bizionia sp. M204]
MKKFLITLVLIPFFGIAQTLEGLEYISPFNNDVAAIKKDNEWGFIDQNGKIIVDFRNDLILTKTDNANYPIFSNERCLIAHHKDGVLYYGYIDKTGKTVITPQFLNASNFKNDVAVALKLVKEESSGMNELMKNIVNYHYYEVVIEKAGEINQYLTEEPIHITLTKEKMKKPPVITSKLISNNLIAVRNNNNKWTLKKISE